jgi:hypothetical protein
MGGFFYSLVRVLMNPYSHTLKSAAILLGAWFLCSLSNAAYSGLVGEWMLGKWAPGNTATKGLHGNMEIKKDRVFWEHQGWIHYKVLTETDTYILVELEKPTFGVTYIKFSFSPETGTYTDYLEMTGYRSPDKASERYGAIQGFYSIVQRQPH